MKVYCLNKISKSALNGLKEPDLVVNDINDADGILVRSQDMKEMELGNNILAVARAGAGVNNIPVDKYASKGVVVFNTPGANANAVKELVLCGLLLASRDIIGGTKWIEQNKDNPDIGVIAEKAKSQFAGNEIMGKTIGVIGLGVIGVLVANACIALGMKVKGYDPYLTINNAMLLNKNVKYIDKLNDVVSGCDFVTIHVPLMESTKGMLNKSVYDSFKKGTILLNYSRNGLVNYDDLKEAMDNGKVKKYVTDFVDDKAVKLDNTIIFPHLGASTAEAEDNCAVMAINELDDYIKNGNISHSVNYPDLNAGPKLGKRRLCALHKNIPGIISQFTSIISSLNVNIDSFTNKSRGEYAYSVFDLDDDIDVKAFDNIDAVIRVRII